MNLQHLRDECPLTEFDFAAVRARVRSEIVRRQRRAWVFRFASAFAMVVLVILALVPVEPVRVPLAIPRGVAAASAAEQRVIPSRIFPAPEAGAAPRRVATRSRHRRHHPHHQPLTTNPQLAVSRIEIHTADPDVRIIWIVPKENS